MRTALVTGATGFVGRVHMEGIVRTGFVELYGLSEPQLDKAKQLGEEYRVYAATVQRWIGRARNPRER